MSKCDNCRLRKELAKAFDIHWLGEDDCPYDKCPVKTNGDRIRRMTDEELAHLLHSAEVHLFSGNLMNHTEWLDWLKQEAE